MTVFICNADLFFVSGHKTLNADDDDDDESRSSARPWNPGPG